MSPQNVSAMSGNVFLPVQADSRNILGTYQAAFFSLQDSFYEFIYHIDISPLSVYSHELPLQLAQDKDHHQ